MKGKRVNYMVILVLSVLLTSTIVMQSFQATAESLEMPTANLNVENVVPFDTIKAIAFRNAKALWGEPIAMGPAIPYCDLDGNIVAYVFAFRIGSNSFPTYEEILREIEENNDKWDEQ